MIKIHETDKNGLFVSMTGNRSKILKETLKKEGIYQGKLIKYTSTYNNEERELEFNPHNIQYIKHTKSNFRLDSVQLNTIYHSIFHEKESLKEELSDVYKNFIILLQEYSEQIDTIVK